MKNQREIYEALLAGETLIHESGNEVEMNKIGDLIPIGCMPTFNHPEDWQIYKEPEWQENIIAPGVLCWHKDGSHKTMCVVCNKDTMGNFIHNFTPLTKQEIQVFKENAPDEL